MNAEDDHVLKTKLLKTDTQVSSSISEVAECSTTSNSNLMVTFPSAKDAENTEKDGCWAWVVCGAAFCDLFIVLGMHYTVGVLYAALLDHFKESKSKTGTWTRSSVYNFHIITFRSNVPSPKTSKNEEGQRE